MRHLTFKNTLIFLQGVFVILIGIGVLPRYYAFFIAIAAAAYILFADKIDAIGFCIASIPFYIALPITQSFDTLIYWRILFLELFAILIFKNRKIMAEKYRDIMIKSGWKIRLKEIWENYKIEILTSAIFLLALLSLIGAPDKTAGLKRIIYYANIFIFYIIVKYSVKNADDIKKILRHLGAAAIVFLAAGFAQLFAVYCAGIEKFWQFWSSKIALVFYGKNLSEFVSFNNSWFAFSSSGGANLRMFSFFWCSLAFAMSMIMMIVIPFSLYKKAYSWIFLGFLMMAVILSGSRGAWLSIVFAISAILILAMAKKTTKQDKKIYIKKILLMFLLFGALFPLSPVLLGSRNVSSSSIGRIWTVKDTSETSNKARIEIWKTSLQSIKKHPIFGSGVANFSAESDKFGGEWKTTSHNIFLYIATEAGIPAAIFALIICFYLFKDFLAEFHGVQSDLSPKNLVRKEVLAKARDVSSEASAKDDEFFKMFFISSAVAITWVLGYSLIIDSLMTSDKTSLIFVTIIGLFYAAKRQKQKRDALGVNMPEHV